MRGQENKGNNAIPAPRQHSPSPSAGLHPGIIIAISNNLAMMIARFNVNIAQGQNRVREVGRHKPYDDLDTRQSETNFR